MSSTAPPRVAPARLSFLALYNPALGSSDATFHDQVVFYYATAAKGQPRGQGASEHEHEKLRQVGLAQGVVGFAQSFSNREPVETIETRKARIVLKELEDGWWILASIDLTQLPGTHGTPGTDSKREATAEPQVEYSSREVSPPALLLQQLVRAHRVFSLHHGSSLTVLFEKLGRAKFCTILENYWFGFAENWDVLLHGSPAVDMYGGMKLAAGGELGMGVGEEEWGSGEREVLEDFVRRTDGLVDIMVSRFGEPSPLQHPKNSAESKLPTLVLNMKPWIGCGEDISASDGVVFSGIGAISRRSLTDLSHWVESIYCYGDRAYGVKDNPTADRKKRRRRNAKAAVSDSASLGATRKQNMKQNKHVPDHTEGLPPGIPPPIVKAVESSLDKASNAAESTSGQSSGSAPILASLSDTDTWMKYLTLGYGTAWGGKRAEENDSIPKQDTSNERGTVPEAPMRHIDPTPDIDVFEEKQKAQIQQENSGYFIIGLKGNMNHEEEAEDGDMWNNRIPIRTVHVELASDGPVAPSANEETSYELELSLQLPRQVRFSRLRPVVYVHRPFIYTFLFHHRTESLTISSFYRNLHNYFSPLHRPLSGSTSPDKVAARISAAAHPCATMTETAGTAQDAQPIYDLVYDPRTLTVHSNIPNIPDPGTLLAEGLGNNDRFSGWSRVEALNVHSQILATVADTRRSLTEIERTCKTGRSWWVVWMRLPPSHSEAPADDATSQEFNTADVREAFLLRRARDAASWSGKKSGTGLLWRLGPSTEDKMGGMAAGWGPRGLAEGIGIDARRYVEGLLSLNR